MIPSQMNIGKYYQSYVIFYFHIQLRISKIKLIHIKI